MKVLTFLLVAGLGIGVEAGECLSTEEGNKIYKGINKPQLIAMPN